MEVPLYDLVQVWYSNICRLSGDVHFKGGFRQRTFIPTKSY